jgi:hypothetical protein
VNVEKPIQTLPSQHAKKENEVDLLDIDELVRQVEALATKEIVHEKPILRVKEEVEKTVIPSEKQSEKIIQDQNETDLSLEAEETPPPSPPQPQQQKINAPKLSLKDYYLSEYDDESETTLALREPGPKPVIFQGTKTWKLFLKILGSTVGLMAIVVGLVYLWISDQSGEEEIKAARSVSDVAMALTYAQIKHIRPQNQNWSDPEFIKNNLTAVLATEFASFAEFDNHGQFNICPFMLRIYTSSDLSQFLVIAQPAPSLLHWLVPKASIVIDSRAMELRKIKDLKTLNRMLVNANTLDGTNAGEVSHLIQQGELIPLQKLVSKKENQGFAPPKALALIRPNAENLIYNAPRYYALGENIILRSQELADIPGHTHEEAMLFQEILALAKFPNLVLYSSGGIQHAMQAQKALATLAPKEKFLLAYLQVNARGKLSGSPLLVDDTPSDVAMEDSLSKTTAWKLDSMDSFERIDYEEALQDEPAQQSTQRVCELDKKDPVFLQLSAVLESRQKALKPISDEIITTLKKETLAPQKDFADNFVKMQSKYMEVVNEQKDLLLQKVSRISREAPYVSAANFVEFVKTLKLDLPFQEYIASLNEKLDVSETHLDQLDHMLIELDESHNWHELEQHVQKISLLLQFDTVPDLEKLIALQNNVKSRVTQKLNIFLLSADPYHPPIEFSHEYKDILRNILRAAWISDGDACDFYLSEFELRTKTEGKGLN